MIIKVLPEQIPLFWEAIKTAAVQADEVDSKDLPPYLNELLQSLLSAKAQCFAALSDSRVLKGLMITKIQADKITGDKYLSLLNLYAWDRLASTDYSEGQSMMIKFAEEEQCKYLQGRSRHDKVKRLAYSLGFVERHAVFDLKLR